MDHEWEAWQEVVRVSKEIGAITEADWKAPATDYRPPNITPGMRLIQAIIAWGQRKGELEVYHSQHQD